MQESTGTNWKRIGFIILITILILLLLNQCGSEIRSWSIKQLGGYTKSEYKETIDTLSIKYDTLFTNYSKLQIQAEIGEQKLLNNHKIKLPINVGNKVISTSSPLKGKTTETQPKTVYQDSIVSAVYAQINPVSDSLIDGNITSYVNPSDCKIIAQSLDYTLKKPTIVKTITIEKSKETTLSDKPIPKIGIGVKGSTNYYFGLLGAYQTKTNWQFQGGYVWNTNTELSPDKNKGVITFGILKLF